MSMENLSANSPYFGIFMILILSFLIFFALTKISANLGAKLARKNTQRLKLAPYECGPAPSLQKNTIAPQFFIMAVLFILFDVEIIFMFPWAVDFRILGLFGFVEMLLFVGLLAFGFIYAWVKGALKWQSIK